MSLGFKNNGVMVQEYVYDFAVDGGAVSVIDLSAKDGYDPIPIGAIVKDVVMKVVTAFTSGGSATMKVGSLDDDDGFIESIAVATLADNYVSNGGKGVGALLWDNSNDNYIPHAVLDANDGAVAINIETAAMTAGKAIFLVEYYFPSLS